MTTTERTAIRAAMERAARQLARREGEEVVPPDVLDALARAAEAQAVPVVLGEAVKLREENAELADQLAAVRRSLDEAERTAEQLRRELRDAESLRRDTDRQLDKLTVERTKLHHDLTAAQQTARKPKHRHAYPWSSPDELPGPCECGHPFPRALDEDDEEIVPELTPWDELMERVRYELELAGWPPEATDER